VTNDRISAVYGMAVFIVCFSVFFSVCFFFVIPAKAGMTRGRALALQWALGIWFFNGYWVFGHWVFSSFVIDSSFGLRHSSLLHHPCSVVFAFTDN